MGDGIMALFGAPLVGPNDADSALAAADDMMRRLADLNVRRVAAGQVALDIGIGFSTGPTVVGNIGSVRRLDYTVIGDNVNLASRLEGATKQYGARIVLSESTVRDLKRPATLREIDLIRVKGKDRPVAVYESLGYRAHEQGLAALLDLHAAGLAAYRARDWAEASRAFEAARELYPDDGPTKIYLERCRVLANSPPPSDWDGEPWAGMEITLPTPSAAKVIMSDPIPPETASLTEPVSATIRARLQRARRRFNANDNI
eukprot:gene27398-48977_t